MKKYIKLLLLILFSTIVENFCAAQSPFRISSPSDYITIGLMIPANFAANSFYKNKKPLTEERILSLDTKNINWFDRSAVNQYSIKSENVSDILAAACLIAPAFLLINKNIRNNASTPAVIYFEAIAITSAEIQFIKGLIDRPRPFVYNSNVAMDKKLKPDADCSFFSGHTAMAAASCFFAAGIYEGYYPESTNWIWLVAAVPPLATGYFRYKAGKHFFTDILTGFVVGSLNGYLITRLHKRE